MSKQHKWYNEILAWANGAEIECRDKSYGGLWGPWSETAPDWDHPDYEFRIVEPKKPDTPFAEDIDTSFIEYLIKIARGKTSSDLEYTSEEYMDVSLNTMYRFGYDDGKTGLARHILKEKGIEWSAKVTYE